MERHLRVKYAVYYNIMNPHVTIHKIPAEHELYKKDGYHEKEQGGWGYFVEEYEAKYFADGVFEIITTPDKKPVNFCSRCFSHKS